MGIEISSHASENFLSYVSIKDSIATQLLRIVFTLYLVVAIMVTGLHMVAEFYSTKETIADELRNLHKMTEPASANALWNVNMEQLRSTLLGLVSLPVVMGIRIEDEQKQTVAKIGTIIDQDQQVIAVDMNGKDIPPQASGSDLFWYQAPIIYHDPQGGVYNVGTATFYSSTHIVLGRVQLGFLLLIGNAVIKTIALWIFFLWYGRRLLTRPLAILTDVAKKLDLEHLNHLQVNVQTVGRNELKILEEAFNTMIQKLFAARQQLAELQAGLEHQVAIRTQELQESNGTLIKLNQKIAMLNRRLQAENLRMSNELEIAQRLQHMILPKDHELTEIRGLDIAGFMEPAEEVGGDYYDVLECGEQIRVSIGDVTGHGLESGVLMLMIQTALRTLTINHETDPLKFFNTLNQVIYGNAQRMGVEKSLSLCVLDYRQGELSISGQHESVLVVRQGHLEIIDTVDLGFPIGLEHNITDFVAVHTLHLEPGDLIVLYTDGITEAEDQARQLYGQGRLCDLIQKHWRQSAKELINTIATDLKQFIGQQRVYDDLTLLVIKRR